MRLDLHVHTHASDGAWSPEAVVRAAASGGLDVIAIADHDTVEAVGPAQKAAHETGILVVPALEVSSTWEGREIHVLGYFVDPAAEGLARHTASARTRREARMREMVDRLQGQGIEVTFEDVLGCAGPEADALARPHLARALVARGHASSMTHAFDAHIGDHRPAFVPTELQRPEDAVALVREVGGVAVWAHPPADLVDPLLPGLMAAGLRGVEVYRPSHKPSDVRRLEGICRSAGLLRSGGSDWHTPEGGTALGDFFVVEAKVRALLEEGGLPAR